MKQFNHQSKLGFCFAFHNHLKYVVIIAKINNPLVSFWSIILWECYLNCLQTASSCEENVETGDWGSVPESETHGSTALMSYGTLQLHKDVCVCVLQQLTYPIENQIKRTHINKECGRLAAVHRGLRISVWSTLTFSLAPNHFSSPANPYMFISPSISPPLFLFNQ